MKKHVAVLEEAGLVQTEKVGRERRCSLDPAGPDPVEWWMETHRAALEERLDRLGELVEKNNQRHKAAFAAKAAQTTKEGAHDE